MNAYSFVCYKVLLDEIRLDKLESGQSKLEDSSEEIKNLIIKRDNRLDEIFKVFFEEMNVLSKKIDKRFDKMDTRFDAFSGSITEIRRGLGLNLESLAAEFLKHLLKSRGFSDANVTTNHMIQVPETKTQREIDVYCPDPKIIIECTSFLNKMKKQKLQRFIETRNFLENDGIPCTETYFICYGIHPEILEESLEFMKRNNIILLSANSVLR